MSCVKLNPRGRVELFAHMGERREKRVMLLVILRKFLFMLRPIDFPYNNIEKE